MNQQAMMRQIQKMQAEMAKAQEELAVTEVTGQAGNGLVTVTCTATGNWRGIKIDPKLIDPDDPEMLQDLVLAALNDAKAVAEQTQQERLGPLTAGMSLPGL
jgi:DNA-binding YbaB/EbfC family protein